MFVFPKKIGICSLMIKFVDFYFGETKFNLSVYFMLLRLKMKKLQISFEG